MTVLRMSPEQVQAYQAKAKNWREWPNLHGEPPQEVVKLVQPPRGRAVYMPFRDPPKRGMNKLEAAWAEKLALQQYEGMIDWWDFEPMRLKLADGTYYRPDFASSKDGVLSFWECKGHMREAARVRLNVAAGKFPFPFYLVRKSGKYWDVRKVASGLQEKPVSVPRGPIE